MDVCVLEGMVSYAPVVARVAGFNSWRTGMVWVYGDMYWLFVGTVWKSWSHKGVSRYPDMTI